MGVDIVLWRSRIGSFAASNGGLFILSCVTLRIEAASVISSLHAFILVIFVLFVVGSVEQNPGPTLICRHCSESFDRVHHYIEHQALHSVGKNPSFLCPYPECPVKLPTPEAFYTHRSRVHGGVKKHDFGARSEVLADSIFQCNTPSCAKYFQTRNELLKDVRDHMQSGIEITCPFLRVDQPCKNKFVSVKNFNSHVSLYHKKIEEVGSTSHLIAMNIQPVPETGDIPGISSDASVFVEDFLSDDPPMTSSCPENAAPCFTSMQVRDHVAQFFLKLEGDLVLPSSTVQCIFEEVARLLEMSHKQVGSSLKSNLIKYGLSLETSDQIIKDSLKNDDIFNVLHKGESAIDLTSVYLRKQYMLKRLPYVEPEEIILGKSDGKNKYAHYIPIRKTLEVLLKDKTVQNEIRRSFEREAPSDGVYEDYKDGSVYKEHSICNHQKCIELIFFQDGFDFHPLSASKGIYKCDGFYFTFGNFSPYNRSKVDSELLALLVKHDDMKKFGHHTCTSPLINELNELQEKGIEFDGELLPVVIIFMLSDNLGAHEIGNFVLNFRGPNEFCRFCFAKMKDFQANPLQEHELRTPKNYDDCVKKRPAEFHLPDMSCEVQYHERTNQGNSDSELSGNSSNSEDEDSEDEDCSEGEMSAESVSAESSSDKHYKGVVGASVLNLIRYFHVCLPGLPPCIAHDLFEGVVAYDLKLFISYLIKSKWISLEKLNELISGMRFYGSDSRDQAVKLQPKSKKVSGHASEVWMLLRFLPLIMHDYILDHGDDVWQLILLLRRICEYLCAPKISSKQISILDNLISTYIDLRKRKFPDVPLRAKHHFLTHGPILITFFGPLIHLWTMRFESMHRFFKRAAKAANNFINITYTLAHKFAACFAYRNSGSFIKDEIQFSNASILNLSELKPELRPLITNPDNQLDLPSVTFRGTTYKRGLFVIISRHASSSDILVGEILMILFDGEKLSFVVKEGIAANTFKGFYQLVENEEFMKISVVNVLSLGDFYPLPAYNIGNNSKCLVLKHSFLSLDD